MKGSRNGVKGAWNTDQDGSHSMRQQVDKVTAYQNEARENDYILQSKEIIVIKYSKYIKGSENKHIML